MFRESDGRKQGGGSTRHVNRAQKIALTEALQHCFTALNIGGGAAPIFIFFLSPPLIYSSYTKERRRLGRHTPSFSSTVAAAAKKEKGKKGSQAAIVNHGKSTKKEEDAGKRCDAAPGRKSFAQKVVVVCSLLRLPFLEAIMPQCCHPCHFPPGPRAETINKKHYI